MIHQHTLPKFNIAPEKLPKPNRKVVFQPSFFRGELLNFGRVFFGTFLHAFSHGSQGTFRKNQQLSGSTFDRTLENSPSRIFRDKTSSNC